MTTPARSALVADPASLLHLTGFGHPERPERFNAVLEALSEATLLDRLSRLPVEPASDEALLRCHTKEYVELARREILAGFPELSTGDTVICEDSLQAALMAAGGTIAAVDVVMSGRATNAFCDIRPPGHHATPDRGMGFCIFNNVAIGARHAQETHGIGRVLIVDWDVHHGNGTQDIFYEDDSVMYFSTHQWPFYPGTGARWETGAGSGKGTTINCPMRAGSGRTEIFEAFEQSLLPAAKNFRPELVMISAGFDSREGDLLGDLMLTDQDFADLTQMMMWLAEDHAEGRIVSVLEGGYSLSGLGKAAVAHVGALLG